jgi:hypothetical protein
MPKVPVESLVLDFDFYPRTEIDSVNAASIADAMAAGVEMPPVVACRKTKRVVDGFHRIAAAKRLKRPTIEVEWCEYRTDADLYLDAVLRNAHHGRRLTPYDRTRAIARAEDLGIDVRKLSAALSITLERLEEIRASRMASDPKGAPVALKFTAAEAGLAGGQLTRRQVEANRYAGGMRGLFYVRQVANLLRGGLINERDENMRIALAELAELLRDWRKRKAG